MEEITLNAEIGLAQAEVSQMVTTEDVRQIAMHILGYSPSMVEGAGEAVFLDGEGRVVASWTCIRCAEGMGFGRIH